MARAVQLVTLSRPGQSLVVRVEIDDDGEAWADPIGLLAESAPRTVLTGAEMATAEQLALQTLLMGARAATPCDQASRLRALMAGRN
jgi:hypothetical protein